MQDAQSGEGVKAGDVAKKHWPLWLEHLRGEYYAIPCTALNLSWSDRADTVLGGI